VIELTLNQGRPTGIINGLASGWPSPPHTQ
jgi:hypothetical protein